MASNRLYDPITDPPWRLAADPAGATRGVHVANDGKLWCIYLNGGGNPITSPVVPLVDALPAETEAARIACAAADVAAIKRTSFIARLRALHDKVDGGTSLTAAETRDVIRGLCRMVGVGGPAQDP